MSFATVSSKGQITVPAAHRRSLGIKPNDRVSIEIAENAIVIRPVVDFLKLKGALGKAKSGAQERRAMQRGAAGHAQGRPGGRR